MVAARLARMLGPECGPGRLAELVGRSGEAGAQGPTMKRRWRGEVVAERGWQRWQRDRWLALYICGTVLLELDLLTTRTRPTVAMSFYCGRKCFR